MSRILILDFGSQYTQLIARRLRENKVYCEIFPANTSLKNIKEFSPQGLILSGGPFSVYDKKAPKFSFDKCKEVLLKLNIPVLGICYGMQYLAQVFGGKVHKADVREYGRAFVHLKAKSSLMPVSVQKAAPSKEIQVWMSHGDEIKTLPQGFKLTANSHNGSPAVIEDDSRRIYAVQFHPEVNHTHCGRELLERFVFEICKAKPDWDLSTYLKDKVSEIKEKVGDAKVICALSGGVDSTVAAALVQRAIGSQLHCVFVNNGLLRKYEAENVLKVYKETLKFNINYANATNKFLSDLRNVTDAERKRKIIGRDFIEVFNIQSKKIIKKNDKKFLVQGTLYPDVIESLPPPRAGVAKGTSIVGFSSTIKSHHNVGGLPKNLNFTLIEPLRELFKDEVRNLGRELDIPEQILRRHPFPGPGLAVRIIGAITKERLDILREVDFIFLDELHKSGLYEQIWQAFAVFLPVRSVGVMGDGRTYDNVVALRAVTSQDGMTADWFHFNPEFLAKVSNRITGEVRGVNRVVYDISSKPPATIEWE